MKKNMNRLVTGMTGAAMLMSSAAAYAETAEVAVSVESAAEVEFKKIANVEGTFAYDQNVVSPADDVYSIFGTAVTGACAKPGFVVGDEDVIEDRYINVSGTMKRAYQVNLSVLEEKQSEQRIMACSCATGPAVVNANVLGIPVSKIVNLAEVETDANTITFRGADGYGMSMPLSYVLEKDAMLVYEIGGEKLPDGQRNQIWMPETVAKYFTRNVVGIELSHEAVQPVVDGAEEAYQAKINILNDVKGAFAVGDEIRFEGYADDMASPIAAIEFSMDGGETWTKCETAGATADKWVYWSFAVNAAEAGTYNLQARAVTADGTVSPLASSVVFTVE